MKEIVITLADIIGWAMFIGLCAIVLALVIAAVGFMLFIAWQIVCEVFSIGKGETFIVTPKLPPPPPPKK